MEETVLVTGATGFLGGVLVDQLIEQGRYRVRALVRSSTAELPGSVELFQGDVLDLQSLIRACEGCVAVFHVAGYVKSWSPHPSRFFKVNVGGLENVLEAVKQTPSVKKLIYTSSFFALGPSPDGKIADETQLHSGKGFCTEYEKSKFEADVIARKAAAEGVPIVHVYPGVIYGPGKITKGNIVAEILIERFNGRLPGYVGYGHDRFSFCHVEDVAAGHIAALEKGVPGERYILSGTNASLVDVFDISSTITKTRRPFFHIPLWIIHIYGYLSVVLARVTGVEPVISHPAVAVIKLQWAYSSSKAESELGYKYRSLHEGLRHILVFLKEEGSIKY